MARPLTPITPRTSDFDRFDDDDRVCVDFGTLKQMLAEAYGHYQKAFDDGDRFEQGYWDGSIRQLHYMLELHGQ